MANASSMGLTGDWINDPCGLDQCQWHLQSVVSDLQANPKFKYHNQVTVIRDDKSVMVWVEGMTTGVKDTLCGFGLLELPQPIQKQNTIKMTTDFKMVPLGDIHADPNQPRRLYDETAMQELTDSVKEKGILQPLLLRPNAKGYIIVCGERRYRAAGTAGLAEIPAVIRELSDDEALELQIIENLQRKDVHPMEEAVAFKSLLESKTKVHTAEEIGHRVGKSVYYVRQRMKLNDLTKEWQQTFFHHQIDLGEALKICMYEQKVQAEMWKEAAKDRQGKINLSSWFLDKFRGDLHRATFDLADATLDKKMGACTTCQFNSAAASLFPDANDSPRCGKPSCFKHKSDIQFERQLKAMKQEPGAIFINTEYHGYEDNLTRELQKEGHTYINGRYGNQFREIAAPEKPDWEEFKESAADDEDLTEAQVKIDFEDELKAYEKDLADYQKKIEGGKYKKALVVNGNEKGQVLYLEIGKSSTSTTANGSSKKTAEKAKEGTLTATDVEEEIQRLREREKRNKEIDINKIHKATLEQLDKVKKTVKTMKHQAADRAIMIFLLLRRVGDYGGSTGSSYTFPGLPKQPAYRSKGYQLEYFQQLGKMNDDQLAGLVRAIAIEEYGTKNFSFDVSTEDTTMRLIAQYAGVNLKAIEKEQQEIADERQDKVNKRIVALNAKKKELKPAKKAAKKAK
jgi:ParB family chromosome partitioning protein